MKLRGFEEVTEAHRQHGKTVSAHGQSILLHPSITKPRRGDNRSAGYDFYSPIEFTINPGDKFTLWTNLKAYMQDNEVLKIYPRSSKAGEGLVLKNVVGIIDSSYYENPKNDGNIGIMLHNTSGRGLEVKANEKIAQGIFLPYLLTDDDEPVSDTREGGFGSTGR